MAVTRPNPLDTGRGVPWRWLLLGLLAVLALGAVGLQMVPSGKLAHIPHKPVDLTDRVLVDGKRADPVHGKVFLVGVEPRKVSMLQWFLLSFDDTVTFVPEVTPQEQKLQDNFDKEAIGESKEIAAAVVLSMLGEKVTYTGKGAVVASTVGDTPAARLLEKGDRIVKLNGAKVRTATDVTGRIGRLEPGTKVELGIRRDGRPAVVNVTTVEPVSGDKRRRSRLGLELITRGLKIQLPRKVKFTTERVVGPSAGLAFALALYDSLEPGDLLRGRRVVSTGALYLEGDVFAVGGVREKAIAAQNSGADLFIVPKPNVDAAVEGVRVACDKDKATTCTGVLPVRSVAEAVKFLEMDSRELERHLADV